MTVASPDDPTRESGVASSVVPAFGPLGELGDLLAEAEPGIGCIDASGRFLGVNRRLAELLGTPSSGLVGRSLHEFVEAQDHGPLAAGLARAERREPPEVVLSLGARASGARLSAEITGLGGPGDASSPFLFCLRSVAAQAAARATVRRSRWLHSEAQRVGRVGSFVLEFATGRVRWSDELYRLHGVSPSTFVPTLTSTRALFHPDDVHLADAMGAAFLAGDRTPHRMRYRVATDDGAFRILEAHVEMTSDENGAVTLVGSTCDVTQEVLAQAQLRQHEARYHGVFTHAIGGIVRTAMDGTIIEANPAFVSILACTTAEQVIGTPLHTWFEAPAEALKLDLTRMRPGHRLETTLRRLDGRLSNVIFDGLPLDESGERYYLHFVHDITPERERVAREKEVVAASEAKTAFMANMSHELRTPLNAILGLSEALLERTFGPLFAAQAQSLETIHASGKHLLALINDVLDIARVEAGEFPIDSRVVALRATIDESMALVLPQVQAKRQALQQESDNRLPSIAIDKRRIKQVLINLLGNAVKFSPAGSTITLRARARPARNIVEISVVDEGCGIAPEDHKRIFEPFVTLEGSPAGEQCGAGLGLTMVRRIVELHGGRAWVESDLGRGATFFVELPSQGRDGWRRTDPPSASGPTVSSPYDAGVLVLAEDNEANVITFQGYLESRGFTVRVVRDGASAVVAACEPDVAVVLMDVRLPVIDGLEAMRRIRRAETGRRRLIIALTAHALPDDEARCLEAGADCYLSKPIGLKDLTLRIETLLATGAAAG